MRENGVPQINLFVVHWNRPVECIATVRALLDQGLDLKGTVIDNHSTPDALCVLRSGLNSDTEILELGENLGWGPALNVALRQWLDAATDPYCLISAHDAVPASDCLALLTRTADADERIGILCPQYPDDTVAHFSPWHGVYQDRGVRLQRGSPQIVDVPHGTLMLVRRTCLAEIGLFDERYFAYGDEHELGARAVRAGWKVGLVWGALVINPGTWTASPLRSYLFTRNSLLLVRDYYGRSRALLRALLILANTLRLMISSPDQAFAFSVKARLRAVLDFMIGRFGRPNI
jgi:N-acetylglucosaminyl-diphospho-decaprenol L-rhamnosyltransferase